jgi:hypothetical protein
VEVHSLDLEQIALNESVAWLKARPKLKIDPKTLLKVHISGDEDHVLSIDLEFSETTLQLMRRLEPDGWILEDISSLYPLRKECAPSSREWAYLSQQFSEMAVHITTTLALP